MTPTLEETPLLTKEQRLLQRQKVVIKPQEVSEDFGKRVQAELGYAGHLKESSPLRQAFAACNLEPFLPSSVERYKAAMMRKHSSPQWQQRLFFSTLTMGAGSSERAISFFAGFMLFFFSVFLVIVVLGFGTAFGAPVGNSWGRGWLYGLVVILSVIALVGYVLLFTKTAKWVVTDIRRYSNSPSVPREALEMALALKTKCPTAVFEVEELVLERNKVSIRYDPLLRITLLDGMGKGEIYYFAAWLEERFVF